MVFKKNFKLPKKISLLDGEYKIKFVDEDTITSVDKIGNSTEYCGCINHQDKIIYLNNSYKPTGQEKTIWHELGHHFAAYYGLRNNEMFAESFAKFILNCLKQMGYKK